MSKASARMSAAGLAALWRAIERVAEVGKELE
jgi:hypothetical protein